MAEESTPLAARLLGAGARGAGAVGRVTGIDKAVEMAAEEAIVAAVESEAVERAIARVLAGPVIEEAVEGALDSATVKKAILETLDSELVDEVWQRLLAGPQVQQLVERIAEAPEVRGAIAAQSVGLIGDIGRQIAKLARDLDSVVERVLRRIFFRRRRPLPTDRAGLVSRGAAFVIDAVIINLFFTVVAGALTLLVTFFGGSPESVPRGVIAVGSLIWMVVVGLYLGGFWMLEGPDAGDALPRRQAERDPAVAPARVPPTGRPRPLLRHLRDRLHRHRLRRIAPRLGRPAGLDRSRLRRSPARGRTVVDLGRAHRGRAAVRRGRARTARGGP